MIQTVNEYGKRLFGFIRNRVRSEEDAEDILQDVWFQLSSVVDLEQIEQMGAWLFRVARNKITDRYRKQTTESLEDLAYEDDEGELNFKDILLSEDATPETEFVREAFWQELMTALNELPPEQRDVFIWNELEDQTFQEIADRTGENPKTLISRKRYAVQALRKRLDALYRDFMNY
ncbi:RNA polymerase sigma factor [Tellurirhabdus rosea]|uniref:RNA polymerase sigma factor n=1 Tax=Tellurirhabdus rosea TaxID=2674997 RepID=UPI003899BFA9